uniref:transposase n=1 Tax=Escherichia coli TaxID=562 RepID=UPI001FCE4ACF
RDLKAIYQAPTEEAGQQALEAFAAAWDSRYPQISRSWQANWPNLATFFAYPTDIRKVNRPGFPGECFICELRLPDHRFRWKH